MEPEKLRELCRLAVLIDSSKGEAIFCRGKCSEKNQGFKIPLVSHEGICRATTLHYTGYANPEISVNLEEMYQCKHRKPSEALPPC